MIGSEDSEELESRLHKSAAFFAESDTVSDTEDGVLIHLQSVHPNHPVSLHFMVAWMPAPEWNSGPQADSCWFAVDQAHDLLLRTR